MDEITVEQRAVILAEVKKRLQIPHNHMDDMLSAWIESVITYLKNAGCNMLWIETAYGVISRGVYDMWTRSDFSGIFMNMVTQLALTHRAVDEDEELATEEDIDDIFKDDTSGLATEEEIDDMFDDGETEVADESDIDALFAN